MEDDRERSLLTIRKIAQRVRDSINGFVGNLARKVLPAVIAHIIDVTITAIDVAAAGNFQEHSFEFDWVLGWLIQINPRINGSDYAGCACGYKR